MQFPRCQQKRYPTGWTLSSRSAESHSVLFGNAVKRGIALSLWYAVVNDQRPKALSTLDRFKLPEALSSSRPPHHHLAQGGHKPDALFDQKGRLPWPRR